MPHRLIVGGTMTGKTTLAKQLVTEAATRGLIATVHDPLMSDWPGGAIVLHDADEYYAVLLARIKAGQRQLNVCDEADLVYSHAERDRYWVATRGRHYGLENIFITQRPQMLAPTIRTQCTELFCFRVAESDAALLSQDFSDTRIKSVSELQQGEYFYSRWVDGKKTLDKYTAF